MEQELENVLRSAPTPAPPAGLKERLIAQVRLPATRDASLTPKHSLATGGWFRRWWPVLAPAAVSVACAVGLTVQQTQIHELKKAIQDLSRSSAKTGAISMPTVQTNDSAPHADAAARTQQEVARLKELAGRLEAEVAQLEQLRADNTRLRTQLAAPPAGFLTPEETEALAKAKERAESITCINNLKQLGLSVKVWAIDNADGDVKLTPPNILSMSNELFTPKVLVCPADHAREPAKDWASYASSSCSYEYLAPSAPDTEPYRVLFRCPIHGHICLGDGSVQSEVATKHAEQLVLRNGKLYQDPSVGRAQTAPAPVPQPANRPPVGSNP